LGTPPTETAGHPYNSAAQFVLVVGSGVIACHRYVCEELPYMDLLELITYVH